MTQKDPRLSHQTLRVLRVFLQKAGAKLAGSDIGKETGLGSGTIYPILARFEQAKWLASEWETLDPEEAGRPRKRLYRLTGLGQRKAIAALSELELGKAELAWNV